MARQQVSGIAVLGSDSGKHRPCAGEAGILGPRNLKNIAGFEPERERDSRVERDDVAAQRLFAGAGFEIMARACQLGGR
jgi:hypothetical protein